MRARIVVALSVLLGVSAIVAAVAVARTSTAPMGFTAKLNIAQEVPKETGAPATAGGAFTATLTGKTLKWKLTFSHLTGAATAAHIHLGAKGTSGVVIVPLCGPCKSPASGSAKITSTLVKDIEGGKTYVNVHTVKNPNGEIRGQVS